MNASRLGSKVKNAVFPLVAVVFLAAGMCSPHIAFAQKQSLSSIPKQANQSQPSIINPDYDHQYDNAVTRSPQGFTHPGILHSRADLNRMRDMAQAGYQPWARGFSALRAVPYASKDYVILGPYKRVEHGIGQYEFRRDASAAYDQTIMWYITGDPDYAAKAIKILNAWSHELNYFESDHITGGMGTQKYAAAAEILRYTPSSGWKPEDIEQFKKFLILLTPAVDKPNLFMNQGGYGLIGSVAIAVFLDDVNLYKKQINRATVGDSKNPLTDTAISKTIWPSGQVVEMGRDQAHPQGGLGTLSCVAQTAYIQGLAISGVDLFTYLDDRLLKGYEYLAAHELGYDEVYEPLDKSGQKGFYARFSPTSRGDLNPIYELAYNHYRYVLKVPPAQLRFTREALDYHAPEGSVEDFPGFGTLTDTAFEAKEDVPPLGPPRQEPKAGDPAVKYGRFQAANFSGSKGVSREYYTDADGRSRLVASNIKADFSAWYNDFDFGTSPVDTLIVSAGSASPAGSKIDLRLDKPDGELVATLQVNNTGWWSTFETFTARLSHPVSGKHTIYMRFYGGNHVYGFQCNLDWFTFAHHSAQARNQAVASDDLNGIERTTNGEAGDALSMKSGSSLHFRNMDFDDGAASMTARVATTGKSSLLLRRSGPQGAGIATFPLPDTQGKWQTFDLPMTTGSIYGKADVSLVASGTGEIKLDWVQFSHAEPRFRKVSGTHYSAAVAGVAEKIVAADGKGYVSVAGSGITLAYPGVGFSNGVSTLAIRLAAAHEGTIEIRSMDRQNAPFTVFHVPATGGADSWRTLNVDIRSGAERMKGVQMLFLTFRDGPMKLDYFQLEPAGPSN